MKLSPEQKKVLENALLKLQFELHDDYSGRGMMSRQCFGFSTDAPGAIWKLALELSDVIMNAVLLQDDDHAKEIRDVMKEMARNERQDNLGHDTIYYYPTIQWK